MLDKAIEEHTGEETLTVVESIHRVAMLGAAEIFALAAHFADIYNASAAEDAHGRSLPGMGRPLRLGGEGTPLIKEFAIEEFGARMQLGPVAVRHYFADVLDTRDRLPRLWARVQDLEVKVSYARFVAQTTRHLSAQAARQVDVSVAAYADGRISRGRFETLVEAKVIEADPETAAAREAAEAAKQFARAGRSNESGMRGFYLRSSAGLIARVDATVAYLAEALKALGDPDEEDLRRVKACAIMANPGQAIELLAAFAAHRASTPEAQTDQPAEAEQDVAGDEPFPETGEPVDDETTGPTGDGTAGPVGDAAALIKPRPFRPESNDSTKWAPSTRWALDWSKLLPTVTMYVHLSQDTLTRDEGGVARWEGGCPITMRYIHEHLAPYHRFVIKPVIDLANQTPVDAYECPESTREAVHLRSPAEVFPFSARISRSGDLDHTDPYRSPDRGGPPGQTRLDNLGPLGRSTHRLKTHGAWQVQQPFNGIFIWRDPHGHYYLVDHTGTRKITPPHGSQPPGTGPPRPRQSRDPENTFRVQVWHAADHIEYSGPSHAA